MTTITPDYPDWSPGQVSVAAGITLFNSTTMAPDGSNTGPLDVRALNSVDIWVSSSDLSGFNPIAVEAIWTVGSHYSGVDYCTVGNGFLSQPGGRNSVITLPCRGDTLVVKLDSAATTAFATLVVTGSARTVPAMRASVPGQDNGSILAGGSTVSLGAGATTTLYTGPVSKSVNVAVLGPALMQARVYEPFLSGGVWVLASVSPAMFATNTLNAMNVQAPGRVLEIQVTNTDTATHSVTPYVTDAG